MNKNLLLSQIQQLGSDVESIQFGENCFYFLDDDVDSDIRNECIGNLGQDKFNKIVDEMFKDKIFRNFMLVNLQSALQFRSWKFKCLISRVENSELFDFISDEYIGFIESTESTDLLETLSPQAYDFNVYLTDQYVRSLNFCSRFIDLKSCLIDQVKKLVDFGVLKEDNVLITRKAALIKNCSTDVDSANFLKLWQLNVFFEQYIARIVKEQVIGDVFINKKLCILPNSQGGKIEGTLEIDVMGYDSSKNQIILIECKNGSLRESQLSKFIGRCEMIESTYGIKIQKKAIVGTGYIAKFFYPLTEGMKILDIDWFDIRSFRKDYSSFIEYLNT